jgi:Antibiotic biosynthesis monooxygenase
MLFALYRHHLVLIGAEILPLHINVARHQSRGAPMPTISKGRTPLTFINVFTVMPEKQQELIALLTDVTERHVRHRRGFISASLHRGIDGRKVTMYAQWASIDDYESMRNDSGSSPALEQALAFATFDPGMYEVAEIFSPAKK